MVTKVIVVVSGQQGEDKPAPYFAQIGAVLTHLAKPSAIMVMAGIPGASRAGCWPK